jgi:hypothetical protein
MAGTPNIVELQKARITMTRTFLQLSKETSELEKALKVNADPKTSGALKSLRGMLKADERLVHTLDKAVNEHDEKKQAAMYKSASQAAYTFLGTLQTDRQLAEIENNPVHPVPAVSAMTKALTSLTKALP